MRPSVPGPARRREIAVVAVLAVLPLLPFLDKAVDIDAPVFVAVARQIAAHPADPFGFEMIWDPTSPQVAVFNRNPPLVSYWLAPWIRLFGESEPVMHAAMLPFPLLAALSLFGIARRLTGSGLAPAALLAASPAFLVLSTTLMIDVPVLSWILLAVYALLRGAEPGGARWQLGAGLAAAAAGLTKYVGLSSLPLLAAGLVLFYPRRLVPALRVLGVPLVAWTLWNVATTRLYGFPHFFGATDLFADNWKADEFWNQVLSVPIYYGGALVFPMLASVRFVVRGADGTGAWVVGLLLGMATAYQVLPDAEPSRRVPLDVEEAVFAAFAFASAFALWTAVLRPRRFLESRVDRFLLLWLGGLGVFSALFNWHVNAADALLAAPPLLLLMFRSPALRPPPGVAKAWVAVLLPLSLLLAWTDAHQAGVYREDARRIAREIGGQPGARWFVGHWGLQHYLQQQGFQAVVPPMYGHTQLEEGDWVVSARNVSQLDVTVHMDEVVLREIAHWRHEWWLPLRTTNGDAGAGFYSHHTGYVPIAWSRAPLEEVGLGRVERRRVPRRRADPSE